MTLFYTDLSNNQWQSDQDVIDFLDQLRDQGFSGVIHKVTQGSDYQDRYWMTALTHCIQIGFPIIGYHYLSTDDPAAQAQNWVNAKGTPNAMFDFEQGSGTMDNFWNVANAFNAVGTNVAMAYIPEWYLNESVDQGGAGGGDLSSLASNGINLVSSDYVSGYSLGTPGSLYDQSGGDSGNGWASYNGGFPKAWQFTSTALVAGLAVDVNAYKGDDINQLFGIAA